MKLLRISSLFLTILLLTGQSQCGSSSGLTSAPATETEISDSESSDTVSTVADSATTPNPVTEEVSAADPNPTWSPSSAGSIGCAEATLVAWVSLDNNATLEQEFFSFEVRAREIGAKSKYLLLETHELQTHNLRYTPLDATLWKVQIGITSSTPSPPLVVSMDGSSTNPQEEWCDDLHTTIEQKEFMLIGRYVRPRMSWEKRAAPLTFDAITGENSTVEINPFILEARE